MAQIIKHRRGSLETLSAVTASLAKGEILIATGSSNISPSNGDAIVFAVPENGQVQAVNKVMRGTSVPSTFPTSTYNGMVDGIPYYVSASNVTPTLYLLKGDGNEAIDLIGNIQPFSASVDSRLDSIEASGVGSITALNAFTASANSRLNNLESKSASVDVSITNLNASSASQQNSINTLNSFTSSQNDKNSTLATYTASVNNSITLLNASTASQQNSINALNTYTGSNNTTNTNQNNRLDFLSNKTGSYATTGSNTFYGTQIFSGSAYITGDLIVIGSSSISNISASSLNIGDNQIVLNTFSPSIRYGGISVIDSGSAGGTGSLWWDSVNNHWLYEHPADSEAAYNSAILIAGPKNTGTLGQEVGLTSGSFALASGTDHISSSIMSQAADNSKVVIAGGLNVTGEISSSTINGIGNVSTFSQSVDSRLDAVEASIGGGGDLATRVTALEAFTSSQNNKNTTLATYTGSINDKFTTLSSVTASLNSFTSSASSRLSNLESKSASVDISITNLNASSASQQISINALNSYTSSQNDKNSTLSTYTSSINDKFTTLSSVTASLLVETSNLELFTSSAASRLNNLESKSASVDTSISNLNTYTSSLKQAISVTGTNLTVIGDLTVQGSTVTLNTTELVIEDKLITLASGSTTALAADGAGILVAGANASITYENETDSFTSNKAFSGSFTGSFNTPGFGTSKRVAFRNTVGTIDFVTAPTTDGDLVQWNGTDFVMSNVIDGGTF